MEVLNNYHPAWQEYLWLFLLLAVIIFMRYLLVSVLYDRLIYRRLERQQSDRIIKTIPFKDGQHRLEMYRSAISSVIFSAFAIGLLALFVNGWTKIYLDWSAYPLWYHPLSMLLFLLLQDTYYYWLHRWMHRPGIFQKLHQWHHDSVQTNSYTSFSFNPSESVLQSIFFPLALMALPLHLFSFAALMILMTLSATINHGAVEIYPKQKNWTWIQYWIIGATHHDLHHKKFNYNYGLYFTFWDRLMGTEAPTEKRGSQRHR